MTIYFPSFSIAMMCMAGTCALAQEDIPDAEPVEDNAPLTVNAEKDLFQIAEMIYQQGQNPAVRANPEEFKRVMLLAAQRFSEFRSKFPSSAQAPLALYRMASCMMEAGKTAEAFQTYGMILQNYKGDVAAAAAYRLASEANKVSDWKNAERFYKATITESQRPELKIDAQYRLGRIYMNQEDYAGASRQFEAIVSDPKANPVFLRSARMALASCLSISGKKDKAYTQYKEVLASPDLDAKTRGDALLQVATLAVLLKKDAEAKSYYEEIVKTPELASRSNEARMGLMMSLFKAGDYKQLVDMYRSEQALPDQKQEARRKMLVAQAYEKLGEHEQARVLFTLAERLEPNTEFAMEAAYRRLQAQYQAKQPDFVAKAQAFLNVYSKLFPTSAWHEMVRLMAAESLFATKPAEAAVYYAAIDTDKLPAQMKGDIIFKSAWSMGMAGNRNAALVLFSKFIENYPNDPRVPESTAKKGEMNMNMGKEAEAMIDFEHVIKSWPRDQAAALAWQKLGQIYARKQDIPNMIKYYEGLLTNFPKVMPAALSEARFMVGRGYFDKKDYKASIPNLEEARTLNAPKYGDSVSQLLVLTYYQLQNAEKLKGAMELLREKNPTALKSIPEMIPAWLGMQSFSIGDFETANRYLSLATASEGLKNSKRILWKTLAKTRLALKNYETALSAVDIYLKSETQPYRRAEGMLDKARILVGLGKYVDAKKTAEEGLALGVEGPLMASLKLVLGDIAYAVKEYDEAAKYYGTTAELFVSDKELKPQALYKAHAALMKMERTTEAAHFKTMLDREFPGWKPEEGQSLPGQDR
ncbi:MAG: tetratricopeptide repeat protein [Akkermansia sp.]